MTSLNEKRFEKNPNKLESLSTHKKPFEVNFNKMAKRLDLFESQFGENKDAARKKRPPSGLIVDYDNVNTKHKIMAKTSKIIPIFDK